MRRIGPVVLALALAGCGLWARRPGLAPGATIETLLAGLDARRAAVHSLRARAQIRSGLAQVWVREAVVVERPRAVRVDVFSPFGLALALGTDGSMLWVFPPQEGIRYEGEATPENVARFLGAAVSSEDLVDVLLGVPPRRIPVGAPRSVMMGDGVLRVIVPFADGEQRLDFAGRPAELRRAEEARTDGLVMRVDFDDYRNGFPWRMDIHGTEGATASLRYVEVEPNVTVDASVFRGPDTVRVLPLESIELRR